MESDPVLVADSNANDTRGVIATMESPSDRPDTSHEAATALKDGTAQNGDTSAASFPNELSANLNTTDNGNKSDNGNRTVDESPPLLVVTPSSGVDSTSGLDTSEASSIFSSRPFQRGSSEPPPGEDDDEYFEEFHLPNTHENAFVRHLSFRRKVQTTPIDAPDAERIEGLVRAGEFARHGSIRKRILPEEDEEEDEEFEKSGGDFSKSLENDIREFERYLSADRLDTIDPTLGTSERHASTPKVGPGGRGGTEDTCRGTAERSGGSSSGVSFGSCDRYLDDSIEDTTLRKIQECLDFSAYKDILNLSGRLSDLLSPKEVEEVLQNSERYRQYLDSEVFEALSLSFQGHTQSLPFTVNVSRSAGGAAGSASLQTSHGANHDASGRSESPELAIDSFGDSDPQSDVDLSFPESTDGLTNFSVDGGAGLTQRSSMEGAFAERREQVKRKIPAPTINFDSSSETKAESEEEEKEEEEKEEGASQVEESFEDKMCQLDDELSTYPKKKISVTDSSILHIGDYPDDLPASEYLPREGMMEKQLTDSTTSIMSSDMMPPLETFPMPPPPDLIPELTAAEELSEVRHWRNVVIGGAWRRIDMKVIAPYRKCISHGGYLSENQSPIVVLSAALLPDKSRRDYHYVMDNLFMYVLSFLEQLVADDYVLVYFSGCRHSNAPGFQWMRRAYEMIDRRLRKNLKLLYVVHPSLWSRTILTLSRPFISSKFYRKLKFIFNLTELAQLLPLEQLDIPEAVKQADFEIMIREKKRARVKKR